jgi:hypothetical protein
VDLDIPIPIPVAIGLAALLAGPIEYGQRSDVTALRSLFALNLTLGAQAGPSQSDRRP